MGKFHGGSFQAIQEYFQQKSCRFCDHPFTAEGIELLREEPGMLVVRIRCATCGHPLGIAIVGTGKTQPKANKHPGEWTKKDWERLKNRPPVTYDDVLSAHEFINNLGADWNKYLPSHSS